MMYKKSTGEMKKTVCHAMQNPIAAFTVGALCGLAIGMLYLPFSKGIAIGSYNGNNEDSYHEDAHSEGYLKNK